MPRRDDTEAATRHIDASDAELLRRIGAARDREAFRQIYERYGSKLKAFMIKGGATPDEAEEAVQEALVSVWRRAETFDPTRATAAAWLFTIARNRRIDLVRRGARPQPDPSDPLYLPEPAKSADAQLGDDARDRAVRDALTGLNGDQREVIEQAFFLGRAHAEIAAALGIPLGTVKSRLRLAFKRLKKDLGSGFSEELNKD